MQNAILFRAGMKNAARNNRKNGLFRATGVSLSIHLQHLFPGLNGAVPHRFDV